MQNAPPARAATRSSPAEIATRTAQDALLLALVNAEIAARTAAQLALNTSLDAEIAAREAFDTLAFGEMANLTARLANLTAYDVYAQQEFDAIYNNLTLLELDLLNETATRIAEENVLIAQDAAQQAFIALFASELANETATRTSEGATQLMEIAAFLADGILTINNQTALNHNFNFVSTNPGFTIGSGGTNIITIAANNVITTVNSVTPNGTTFDIALTAGNNIVITPGVNQLTVGLAVEPAPPNWASYYGSWMSVQTGNCEITPGTWFFDAFDIHTAGPSLVACPAPEYIDNFNTYNGFGWEVPSSGGAGYGVWLVHITHKLTVQYAGTPFGAAYSMALCINTHASCMSAPHINEPQSSFVWQIAAAYIAGEWGNWGMNFQDHVFKSTYIIDGRSLGANIGLYPVWQAWQSSTPYTITYAAWLQATSVQYDVTQLA
jgi:hypothetical protein